MSSLFRVLCKQRKPIALGTVMLTLPLAYFSHHWLYLWAWVLSPLYLHMNLLNLLEAKTVGRPLCDTVEPEMNVQMKKWPL